MSGRDLTTLDLVCRVMDSPVRPLDYALLLHFRRAPDEGSLRRGALSARNLYPRTGSRVEGGAWRPMEAPVEGPAVAEAEGRNAASLIQEFLRIPFRLNQAPPLRQLLTRSPTGSATLVTRVHHVAGDLLSTLMWVGHQLRVALGRDEFVEHRSPFERLLLRQAVSRATGNPSAYRGACQPIWTHSASPSSKRDWTTLKIPASEFSCLSRDTHGFTYNDVLLASVLDTLHWWNDQHGAGMRKVGLWVPMNVRDEPFVGFGNGTSRIRVYRRFAAGEVFQARCRRIRSQVEWSRQHGEWAVPERHILTRGPLAAVVLRRYLNRPWADVGSAACTHVERWPGEQDAAFADVQGMEVVGALHARHALMLAAVTRSGETWTTLTYDPALLGADDVASIGQQLKHSLSRAAGSL